MSATISPIEVELKFAVAGHDRITEMLTAWNAVDLGMEWHRDTYFRHPCRDFVQTKEALRIRRVKVQRPGDNEPRVESRITYKGPKLPGVVKARQELEWDVQPVDANADHFEQLLVSLGFESVLTVAKQRHSYTVLFQGQAIVVALDSLDGLGAYVEIEAIAENLSKVEAARATVQALASQLELSQPEPRSYLTMRLQG